MSKGFEQICKELPRFREAAEQMRDELLAHLVLLGEMPAPSGAEEARIGLLLERLAGDDLLHTYRDDLGNGVAVLEGTEGKNNILVLTHADTVFSDREDHTVQLSSSHVSGIGLADDGMGLSALAALPSLLRKLNIQLNSNLVLLATTRSLGAHDLEGLRHFVAHHQQPFLGAICLNGAPLGKLSIHSTGLLRVEVTCHVPKEYDWTRFGATGAIMATNEVINQISAIELPARPRTSIVYATIQGGTSFNVIPCNACLRFDVYSESEAIIHRVERQLADIVEEAGIRTRSEMTFKVLSRRKPVGIQFGHPLAQCARAIIKRLGLKPLMAPSPSELSVLVEAGIPSVTLGLTDADLLNDRRELLAIAPISQGMAQLVGMILALDGGFCHE